MLFIVLVLLIIALVILSIVYLPEASPMSVVIGMGAIWAASYLSQFFVHTSPTTITTPIQPIRIGPADFYKWPIYIRDDCFEVWSNNKICYSRIANTTIRTATPDELPHSEVTRYEGRNRWIVPWAVVSQDKQVVLVVPANYDLRLYPVGDSAPHTP